MEGIISITTSNYHEVVKKEGKAALIFVGDPEAETGVSWCCDCADAEPIIKSKIIPVLTANGYTIYYCLVGDKQTWKDANNPARLSEWIKINSIPTLLIVHDNKEIKRFEEEQLFKEDEVVQFLGEK